MPAPQFYIGTNRATKVIIDSMNMDSDLRFQTILWDGQELDTMDISSSNQIMTPPQMTGTHRTKSLKLIRYYNESTAFKLWAEETKNVLLNDSPLSPPSKSVVIYYYDKSTTRPPNPDGSSNTPLPLDNVMTVSLGDCLIKSFHLDVHSSTSSAMVEKIELVPLQHNSVTISFGTPVSSPWTDASSYSLGPIQSYNNLALVIDGFEVEYSKIISIDTLKYLNATVEELIHTDDLAPYSVLSGIDNESYTLTLRTSNSTLLNQRWLNWFSNLKLGVLEYKLIQIKFLLQDMTTVHQTCNLTNARPLNYKVTANGQIIWSLIFEHSSFV